MSQKTLSRWLKAALAALAIILAVVYAVVIPSYGISLKTQNPEFSNRFYPWLFFLLATAIPFYAAVVFGWLISANIGANRSFSRANARYLKIISILTGAASLYFSVGNTVLLFLNMSHPGVWIFLHLFVLAGFAATVGTAALSHMVLKAAEMKDENDLTV